MAACIQCGAPLAESSSFCPACGHKADYPVTLTGEPASWLFEGDPRPNYSGKATAAMILGFFFFLLPCAFLAVVLGHLSLGEIKKSAGKLGGHGRAVTGLALGYAGIAVFPILLVVAAIVIPNFTHARIAANEESAIRLVRRIQVAEVQYSVSNPDRGYTCNFSDLVDFDIPEANLPKMTPVIKDHGYTILLEGCGRPGARLPYKSYAIAAGPMEVKVTGNRLFCADESMVIKSSPAGSSVEQCLLSGTPL